jgi:spore photoproduct lyase
MLGSIERVIIEEAAAGSATAGRLAAWARAHGVPVVIDARAGRGHAAPDEAISPSKRVLRVRRHAGAVLKPCTGRTDSLLCCNLRVLTQTVGCPLDCSYCVLQDYQNSSEIVVQADPADLLDDLARELAAQPRRLVRVCTGQVADSLALEPEVGFASEAVRRCATLPNVLLELKTKTDRVDELLELPHGGRTVISWSLSPAEVARVEERHAAPLEDRLAAAGRAAAAGYLVAFHLDPMIAVGDDAPGRHRELVVEALAAVPADRLAYVSLGTVRFLPRMRRTILSRFAGSRATLGELLPDVDGKLRLLAPLRVALYRAVAAEVAARCPEAFVYLCMEPRRVWRSALGSAGGLETRPDVELALASSLHRRFGLAPCPPRIEDYLADQPRFTS